MVFISTHVNNGTATVPISAEIGVRVQRLTSEIWNYSIHTLGDGGVQGFSYDWVFNGLKLNVDIIMLIVVPQDNFILALK